jgi:hypothetical protein
VREQWEVKVPSQVAHGAPTPVLKHVQVHLPLELGARRGFSYHTACAPTLPPSPPRVKQSSPPPAMGASDG